MGTNLGNAFLSSLTPPGPEPAQLPPVPEDPAIIAGHALQGQAVNDMNAQRGNFSLNAVAKAAAIVKIWNAAEVKRAALYTDFRQRYQDRLNWLYAHFPLGPGIPDDASPADKAVLMQAWNVALDKARNAAGMVAGTYGPTSPRGDLLEEAQRFGDTMQVRACLTVCLDNSEMQLFDSWAQTYAPQLKAHMDEWRELDPIYEGRSLMHSVLVSTAFRPIPKPQEAWDLPGLVDAHNATVRAHNASVTRPSYYGMSADSGPRRDYLSVPDLLA